jgi:hypothetical protein
MGKGIVSILSPFVTEVYWASKNKERIETLTIENKLTTITPCSYQEALEADIIIHALWFKDLIPWAAKNKEQLANKILVDIVNPFNEDFSDFTLDWGTSAAEELQKLLPKTKIVGAFKNTYYQVFDEPIHNHLKSDVYVTSNDEEAKKKVIELLAPTPFRILDGGQLSNNRLIERLTLFEREIGLRYGNYPYISNHLFGLNL